MTDSSPVLAQAWAAQTTASAAAAVTVRTLQEVADLAQVRELFEQIWRPTNTGPTFGVDLLRALGTSGNYVAGAFQGGDLVGASMGFFAAPAEATLHSHITGVGAAVRGGRVGFALKVHQRAWALAQGVRRITWTFDPLVARNAYFNIGKLGVEPVSYLEDFYGPLQDGINAGTASDRLYVHWPLEQAEVADACAGQPARITVPDGAEVALGRSPDGRPEPGPAGTETVLVAVPADIEKTRAADPQTATSWRLALREVLGGLLADGARIVGFEASGHYVVRRARR